MDSTDKIPLPRQHGERRRATVHHPEKVPALLVPAREPGGSDVSGPSGRSGSEASPWGFSPRLASHVASRKESVGPHGERTDEQTRRHLLQVTERRKPRISGSAPQPRAAKEPPVASVDSKQLAEQTFGGSNLQMCFRGRLERLRVCVSARLRVCAAAVCRGKPV